MMNAWQNETDPVKKKRLARQIQTRVGVKADGVIGSQTMEAIQQAGGMGQPAPSGGFNPNPGQPAPGGGGFFGNLFGQRPAGAPPPPPGGGFGILLIERIGILLAPAWQGRVTLGRGVLTRMERTV